MKIRTLALICTCLPAFAAAQVTAIGPFVGTLQEGYETQTPFQFLPSYSIFGGAGTVQHAAGSPVLHITGGWGFISSISPHSGVRFLGNTGGGGYEYVFNTPAFRFGGYFGTNSETAGATATFFDAQNNQVGGPLAMGVPMGGQWQWDGWEFGGAGISRVVIASGSPNGHTMSDSLEYTAVPEPAAIIGVAAGLGLLLARRKR